MDSMLVSEGRAGLLPPEQRCPQGLPLAGVLDCCLNWLVDVAPQGCGSPLHGASQSSVLTLVAKSTQKTTRTPPTNWAFTMG